MRAGHGRCSARRQPHPLCPVSRDQQERKSEARTAEGRANSGPDGTVGTATARLLSPQLRRQHRLLFCKASTKLRKPQATQLVLHTSTDTRTSTNPLSVGRGGSHAAAHSLQGDVAAAHGCQRALLLTATSAHPYNHHVMFRRRERGTRGQGVPRGGAARAWRRRGRGGGCGGRPSACRRARCARHTVGQYCTHSRHTQCKNDSQRCVPKRVLGLIVADRLRGDANVAILAHRAAQHTSFRSALTRERESLNDDCNSVSRVKEAHLRLVAWCTASNCACSDSARTSA
jgi:hypothetical protein